ncbi:carbohydrate ABC transporter permease [Arachnia propionica]|uniref:Carbohydrate ABC transporter permease n=1 Tax=Arachnia propionica TaxID=1750 RepID=A0A3P1T1P5_9ACTN|nr:carbohydrate ABC transporter permease [Arachnia propionica]MDO5082799.1 carbohydrate ABC transporter permease [Arachnia propionica]RRD03382.1 carbohydrate ABC transporter permease [Arachnia propionica]
MTRDRKIQWGKVISKTLLVLFGLIFVSPFVWMFFSALKPSNEVLSSGTALFGSEVRWDNFEKAFSTIPFGQILVNTFVYATLGCLIVVVVSVLNAYAFARLEFRGRGTLFSIFIATLVLPAEVLVVPLFLGADMFSAVDSYAMIILPFAFGAFGTFMLRQFLLSLPGDYEEAARIDGAGQLKILRHVIVPLLRGPIAVVAAFAFIDYWNSFLWPLIIINSQDKAPLQLGLSRFSGEHGTDWGPLMAAAAISVLASLVIVVAMQKQLAKGINLGGFGGR